MAEIRRYGTALAFKNAVEQRLRDEAARAGTDLGRLRQLLVFDRFLVRIFKAFGQSVLLKGGLVLELRIARARTTRDVDLRMMGDPDLLLGRMQDAGRMEMGDNLSFEIAVDNDHPEILAEGLEYEGRRYRAEARLAGKIYGSAFGVDVAFADPCFGTPEVLVGRPFLAFAGIEPASIRAYPLETHIAEKLHAYTLPRKRVNSRVKDLPDLALLGTVRPMSAIGLRETIQRTFEHRGTHGVPSELPPPPDSWVSLYAKIAQSNDLQWPSLAEVFEVTRQFLEPVLHSAGGQWDPQMWRWT